MKNRFLGSSAIVPVIVGGKPARISVSAIPESDWKKAHGTTYKGTKVNSAQYASYGESTLIQNGNGHTLSMTTDETEVFAVDFLESLGFNITPPSQQKRRRGGH